MKRLAKYALWTIVGLECIFIAVWAIYYYGHQEKPVEIKTTEFLNPEVARESIVRIENEADSTSRGTGFFIAPDLIATNVHVIAQPGPVSVKIIHQEQIEKTLGKPENGKTVINLRNKETSWVVEGVLAFDVKNDIAILKVDAEAIPFVLANSRWIKRNEPVTIIGYPFSKFRVKKGKVYSIRKTDKWLRNDFVIGGGSSGSPLLNSKGKVIGIHAYGQYDMGYSLAPPSNALKKLLSQSNIPEPLERWQNRDAIRAYSHYIKGQESYNAKKYYQSIEELEKAIQLVPTLIYAYTRLGNARSRLAAAESNAGSVDEAKVLYKAAIIDYTQALEYNPKNANTYSRRANAHFELGNRAVAIKDYNRAIQINTHYERVFNLQGLNKRDQADVEYKQGNYQIAQHLYQDAIEYFGYGIERKPKSTRLYLNRGRSKVSLGKLIAVQGDTMNARPHYENAVEDCERAIALSPDAAEAYTDRALVKYRYAEYEIDQQNIDAAETLLQETINDWEIGIGLQPDGHFKNTILAETYRKIGLSKFKLGEIEEIRNEKANAIAFYAAAIDTFFESIQLNSKNAYTYSNRGWGYYLLGKSELEYGNIEKSNEFFEYAINDCNESTRIDPNNAYAFHNRGVIKAARGDISAAMIDFNRAIDLNPRYADAYYQRGLLTNSETDLDKAKELDPNVDPIVGK